VTVSRAYDLWRNLEIGEPEPIQTGRTNMTETPIHQTDAEPASADEPASAAAIASSTAPAGVAAKPTLYVCHGDEGGPRIHPCRRVQEALHEAGIEYDKVLAAHGNPIPFLRKGSREQLREATGGTKLPTLKLADGTVLTHSRAIMGWINAQK
jgi:hypothetical protein